MWVAVALTTLAGASAGCSSTPLATQDSTLAALSVDSGGWLEVTADLAGHVSGQLAPYSWDDLEGTFDSIKACPRLHAQVSANGVEGAWTEVGSGTQINGSPSIYRCKMPAFQVTVPGGLGSELDVQIRDESTQWVTRIRVYQPTVSLVGDAGLQIGTWADLRLDPPPPNEVGLDFGSDAGCAHFTMGSTRSGTGCAANTVVSNVDCEAGPPEAGLAKCPWPIQIPVGVAAERCAKRTLQATGPPVRIQRKGTARSPRSASLAASDARRLGA